MDIVTLGAALNGSKKYTDQVTQSLAGSDIGLAGYTKGTVAKQDVSPTDNVNQGLGKIEKRVSDNENNISLKANTADVNTATANLQTQIDQIAQAAGSGTADTEVAQARIGADGTSYQTLKARLDGENSELKEQLFDLSKRNSTNLIPLFATYSGGSIAGVTFTWSADHKSVAAVGTSTGTATSNIYYNASEVPSCFKKGKTYKVTYSTTDSDIELEIGCFLNGATTGAITKRFTSDGELAIPDNCTGFFARIRVYKGHEANGTASNIGIISAKSNTEIEENIDYINQRLELLKVEQEILTDVLVNTNATHQGITYSWTNRVCTVTGTATNTSLNNLYYNESTLPNGIKQGKTYWITAKSTDTHILVEALVWTPRGAITTDVNFGKMVSIPNDAVGFAIRLRVAKGYTVNGAVSDIHVYTDYQYKMPLKMVTFIDDDTSNDTFVTRYHDACVMNGIKGNYAVMAKRLEDGDTSVNKLLGYEDEGFGMLIHAYWQSGATDWNEGATRNADNCRANLAKGLRMLRNYGFCNYNYWITPGGNRDIDMESIARYLGVECLISTANRDYNRCENASRYYIKRVAFNPTDETVDKGMQAVKDHIDAFMVDSTNGWLIITTHFNEWESAGHVWNDSTGYARFNEIVQYAKTKGCDFKSFQEAWSFYRPYCID